MKYCVLYNPYSGKGESEDDARLVASSLDGYVCREDMTKIGDPADFLADYGEDDALIICGGDGTLNRFVNAIDGIDVKCDVLYYPTGTGNDFLRDIGVSKSDCPISIKKYICDLPTVEVDGKTYRFLNNVGFGIDGYCCEVGDELKKTSDKPVNYTTIAIKGLLFKFSPLNATVCVDGEEFSYKKVWIAPTMKGRYYGGGMMPTPEQDRSAEDRSLSLMVMHGSGKLKTLSVFPSIFKGKHVKHSDIVAIHKGHEISVTFDRPTPLQIDGETIRGVTSYKVVAKAPALTTV